MQLILPRMLLALVPMTLMMGPSASTSLSLYLADVCVEFAVSLASFGRRGRAA